MLMRSSLFRKASVASLRSFKTAAKEIIVILITVKKICKFSTRCAKISWLIGTWVSTMFQNVINAMVNIERLTPPVPNLKTAHNKGNKTSTGMTYTNVGRNSNDDTKIVKSPSDNASMYRFQLIFRNQSELLNPTI